MDKMEINSTHLVILIISTIPRRYSPHHDCRWRSCRNFLWELAGTDKCRKATISHELRQENSRAERPDW